MKKYYSVAIGRSTDMEFHPAPDETCGHKHRTPAAAEKCRNRLIGYDIKTRQCSAKWYNSYIVAKSKTANSGWRGINDGLAGME